AHDDQDRAGPRLPEDAGAAQHHLFRLGGRAHHNHDRIGPAHRLSGCRSRTPPRLGERPAGLLANIVADHREPAPDQVAGHGEPHLPEADHRDLFAFPPACARLGLSTAPHWRSPEVRRYAMRPQLTTSLTRPIAVMSSSGSPSTAITSAMLPGARVPSVASIPSAWAGQAVAARIARIGVSPSVTSHASSSARQPWSASVPTT